MKTTLDLNSVPRLNTTEDILRTNYLFMLSRVLHLAVTADIFKHLEGKALSVSEISKATGLTEGASFFISRALVHIGLLESHGDRFSIAALAGRNLVPGSAHYIGDVVLNSATRSFNFWSKSDSFFDRPPSRNAHEHFLNAMAMTSRNSAVYLRRYYSFEGVERFCDVGGGVGEIARTVAQSHPEIQCVVFDLPETEEAFGSYAQGQEILPNLNYEAGNAVTNVPDADFYVCHNLFRDLGQADVLAVLRNIKSVASDGSTLVVIDPFLPEDSPPSLTQCLQTLNIIAEGKGGIGAYSASQMIRWLGEAGFTKVHAIEIPDDLQVIEARIE